MQQAIQILDEIFNPKCFENWSTTADMKKEIVYPSVMELLDEMPSLNSKFYKLCQITTQG